MDNRAGWDQVFSRLDEDPGVKDDWLARWLGLLKANRDAPILDLGCGAGQDTRFLVDEGFSVVAVDFSGKALEITRRRVPEARTIDVDLTRGLPFGDSSFGAIVASLSLHYFAWQVTVEILEDVRRCLVSDGYLLARLNSTRDAYYAAAEKTEIEDNFYRVRGHPKRLFDRDDVTALFSPCWTIEDASERTTGRYGNEKTLWEISARKG